MHGSPLRSADRAAAREARADCMAPPLWENTREPRESPEVLEALAVEGMLNERQRVAGNPNTSTETLALLAGDLEIEVRWAVAQNAHAPMEALGALARDANDRTQGLVAQNPSVPSAVLALLATSVHATVRARVAARADTPGASLLQLTDDAWPNVARIAARSVATRVGVLGINVENRTAAICLLEQAWWGMTPDSPEVMLALALYPNT